MSAHKLPDTSRHKPPDIASERHEFQLDRLILFTDAVFAIAITLLIIEIKVPEEVHHAQSGREIWHALGGIVLKFTGFVSSFMLIGIYWMVHHRLFRYVVHYNNRLIWMNLLLLMFIVCLPFTTALAFETFTGDVDVSFIIYSVNHIIISLFFMRLWRYISHPAHKLSAGLTDKKYLRYNYWRSLSITLVFVLTIVMCVVLPGIGRFTPMLCMFAIPLVNRRFGFKG
jgi:uncharacterized membrane protein